MLSLEDARALSRYEDRYYDPDCYERRRRDEEELWNRADDNYQDKWLEKMREELCDGTTTH